MSDVHTVATHAAGHQHQFDDAVQQREAGTLGMWVFLSTEVLFFGGMFLLYSVYRSQYPMVFAEASQKLDLSLGTINTIVLICSSLTMALAVYSAETGKRNLLMFFLIATMVLGAIFLSIKGVEYHHKFVDHLVPGSHFEFEGMSAPDAAHAQIFFGLYFAMTGVHALHMIIGFGILITLLVKAYRRRFSVEYNTPVGLTGLYWHFVDIIWIFLYPLLYLLGRHLH